MDYRQIGYSALAGFEPVWLSVHGGHTVQGHYL
jgi:hypothetical protein